MEQKELNNLSAEELDAMADALLAADDAKQAETKAAPAEEVSIHWRNDRKAGIGKDHGRKAQRARGKGQKGGQTLEQGSHGARGHEPLERGDGKVL